MSNREFDLLVIGELNVDLILDGKDPVPAFGQKEKLLSDATLTLGSSSAIFACQAASLGLKTAFIGVVGADVFGQLVLADLAAHCITTEGCLSDPTLKTGISVILVGPNADRAIMTFSGSIGALKAAQIDSVWFNRGRHLHMGSYFLQSSLRPDIPSLLQRAHLAGMTTSLDTNWDPDEKWQVSDLIHKCDVFLPNERELLAITRETRLDRAMEQLSGQVNVIAIKQGPEGATARRGKESAICSALRVQVTDTVGAGDSFDAGFIYGFLHNWPLDRSLKLACVCGSLSTRGRGGTASQPTLAEAMEYVEH